VKTEVRIQKSGAVAPLKRARALLAELLAAKKDAMTALNAAMRRHSNRPEKLRAYPCPNCRGWHLTSKEFAPAT